MMNTKEYGVQLRTVFLILGTILIPSGLVGMKTVPQDDIKSEKIDAATQTVDTSDTSATGIAIYKLNHEEKTSKDTQEVKESKVESESLVLCKECLKDFLKIAGGTIVAFGSLDLGYAIGLGSDLTSPDFASERASMYGCMCCMAAGAAYACYEVTQFLSHSYALGCNIAAKFVKSKIVQKSKENKKS